MPPPRVPLASLASLPSALTLLALLLAARAGKTVALDFAGIASMLASGYAQVNHQNALAANDTNASGRSAPDPQVIYGVPVTTPQPATPSDKPLSYSSLLDALRRQDWAALSDAAGYGASVPLATTASPSENESPAEDPSGGCGPDCAWSPAAAEPDGSYRVLYPVEDGVQEEPTAPDYHGTPTQRGPAYTPETARAEPRFSPAGKHHPVFAAAAAASRPDPYSAGRPSSYQAPSRPPGPGPSAYEYAYPPYSDGGPPPPRPQPRPPPQPPTPPAPEPPKKMSTSAKGGPQKPFLPYAPDYPGGDDYGSSPESPNPDQGYNYKPPSTGSRPLQQGYNYPAPQQSSNQGYDYPKPRPAIEPSSSVQSNEPPKMSPPAKSKPMNYYGSSQPSQDHYFAHGDDVSFDDHNGNGDSSQGDLHDDYHNHQDFSFKPPKDEKGTPQKDLHDHYYGHHNDEYSFNPGELPKPSDEEPRKPEKPAGKLPAAAPMGKPMVYNHPGKLPPPDDHDYSEADDNPPPPKPPSKHKPSNHHYYNSDDYEDHHKPTGDKPMSSHTYNDYDDLQMPPMKHPKPQTKPSPPEPQLPPPQILYHKPSSHLGYHDDYEDEDPLPPPPPKAPKPLMKPEPPPPPSMYHKPTANHAPHHDDYEYDYEEEHDHHTMPPPPPPKDEEQRVNRRPYSYYHLGRKLWYIPLYFSVYFIIYVTALIIKAIARHKIQYPLYYAGTSKDADHHSRRRRDGLVSNWSPGPFQAGLELIMAVAAEVDNALENGERLYKNR